MEKVAVLLALLLCIGIDAKSCKDKVAELEAKPPLLGAFKPKCEDNGQYKETQCHGSTGYCFCVFPQTGEEILGTRQRGVPKSCYASKCLVQRHGALKKNLIGAFQPQCNEDGKFNSLQCHGSTGFCFCVSPLTGAKIVGTEIRGQPNCDNIENDAPKSCKDKVAELEAKPLLLGAFKPKCQANGLYKETQCHGSTGYCFCVFPETGEEIKGTRQRGMPKSCKVTECLQQRHDVLKVNPPLLGAFTPNCEEDGSFKTMQCKEGFCYCVFPSTGKEVLGTMSSVRGDPPKSCKLTKCVMARHQGWSSANWGLLGVPIARCDAYGKYEKVQCRKGMCWCVNPDTGKAVEGLSATWTVPKCD